MEVYVQAIWVTLIDSQAFVFASKAELVNISVLVELFQLLPVSLVSLGVSSEVDIVTSSPE